MTGGSFLQVAGLGSRARSHFPCFVSRGLCPTEIGILCTAHCTPTAGRPGSQPLASCCCRAGSLATNTAAASRRGTSGHGRRPSFASGAANVGWDDDGTKWRLPVVVVVPCALGTPPERRARCKRSVPFQTRFPTWLLRLGGQGSVHPATTATATGNPVEGREQRHDQGKQASNRPVPAVLDSLPSWTVPKPGSTNRIAPGGSSQTPPTTRARFKPRVWPVQGTAVRPA